jgi:hypothetical protein
MRRRGIRGQRALLGSAASVALAALLVVGAAAPAYADTVVIDNTTSPLTGAACDFQSRPLGQTFVATATGQISEVSLLTGRMSQERTRELRIREGGAGGAVLGTQAVTFTPPGGLHTFALDAPVAVASGQTYALELDNWNCDGGSPHIAFNSGYADGHVYMGQFPNPDLDLVFRVVIETAPADADGDGVVDAADACADTTFSAGPAKLKRNQFWSPSADGFVDGTGVIGFTLADTAGCSAEQIITEAGLGKGHLKSGLSLGEMRAWVASVTATAGS